jgi:hypothetical protein
MDDGQQAEFFNALADVVFTDVVAGHVSKLGAGLQWFALCKRLRDEPNARGQSMLMDIAAPMFAHTLLYLDSREANI